MNNNYSKLLAAVGILALATALLPLPGTAQGTSPYGSKVAFGDNDFVPTLAAVPDPDAGGAGVAGDVAFCQVALGDTSLVTDDGYYAIPTIAAPAALTAVLPVNAVRLTTVLGKAPGTVVTDADTSEKGQACVAASNLPTLTGAALVIGTTTLDIFFLSFDAVAAYTSGDCVYLDRDNSGTMSRWDVRLTGCTVGSASYTAGTLVELGEQDIVNSPGAVAFGAAGQFAIWDSQPNGVFDGSDRLYLEPAATTTPGLNSVRLMGGVFGSKVAIGGGDFLVTTAAPAGPAFCHIALGDTSLVTDDGYYLMPAAGAAAATLLVNSIRLTPVAGKAIGTLVGDSDTTEKGQACVDPDGAGAGFAAPASVTIAYAAIGAGVVNVYALSFDQVAGYTSGDCAYLDSGASAVLGTVSRWDIRLTECKVGASTYAAGTLIELGDQDLINSPGAIVLSATASTGWFDSQPNGVVDGSDRMYANLLAQPTNPGINDVRFLGGTYGKKVGIGDDDFIPTLAVFPAAGPTWCHVNLGDTSLVTDDGYYLMPAAAATATLAVNSVRLVTVLGKAPGTVVMDADISEKGQTCMTPAGAAAQTSQPLVFAFGALAPASADYEIFGLSYDQIAAYTSGDCVYANRDQSDNAVVAPGNLPTLTRWDIRLTKCTVGSTTYNAGTLVELGDQDLVNNPGVIALGAAPPTARWWDAQPNGVFDSADRFYLAVGGAGAVRPGLNDVRIIGDFSVATNPGGGPASSTSAAPPTTTPPTTTPPTTTPPTTTPPTTTPPTSTPPTSTPPTSTPPTSNPSSSTSPTTTPGLEIVALVVVLGAALILVRRKL